VTGLTPGSEYHFRSPRKTNRDQPGQRPHLHGRLYAARERTSQRTRRERTFTNHGPAGGNPTATTSGSPSSGQPRTEPVRGLLFGSVKLTSTQHGGVVHGSLVVSSAGSGGRLQIELLSKGDAVLLGKLVRSSLHAASSHSCCR